MQPLLIIQCRHPITSIRYILPYNGGGFRDAASLMMLNLLKNFFRHQTMLPPYIHIIYSVQDRSGTSVLLLAFLPFLLFGIINEGSLHFQYGVRCYATDGGGVAYALALFQ